MGTELIHVATLVAIGVILAYVISNATKTDAVFNGLATLWEKAINGLLGK